MNRTLLVLPLLALAVSACGGDGDGGGSSSGAPLTKAQFIEQADAICARTQEQVKALPTPTDATRLGPLVAQTLSIAESSATQLAALRPPEADAAKIQESFVGPLQTQVEALRTALPAVQAATSRAQLQTALQGVASSSRPDTAFLRSYGFTSCASQATGG